MKKIVRYLTVVTLILSLTALLLMSSGCDDGSCLEVYLNAYDDSSEKQESSRKASQSAAGETDLTLFPEGDSRYKTEGAGWIDPYEFFKVDTIFDLMPILKETKPQKARVTPIVYSPFGRIETTNEEKFEIDLRKEQFTEYRTTYYEGASFENAYSRHEFLVTFWANYDPYLRVDVEWYEYATKDDSLRNSGEEPDATLMTNGSYAPFLNDKKALGVLTDNSYKFLFVINEVYYP